MIRNYPEVGTLDVATKFLYAPYDGKALAFCGRIVPLRRGQTPTSIGNESLDAVDVFDRTAPNPVELASVCNWNSLE